MWPVFQSVCQISILFEGKLNTEFWRSAIICTSIVAVSRSHSVSLALLAWQKTGALINFHLPGYRGNSL